MNSLTDLREVVDVVIGVDIHVHTHSASVVDTATLRAWAIEGTGGHGAGLSRHLLETSEIVIELDRPKRSARRNGAKSDPLDAIRAAREPMARPRLGTPRSGGERQRTAEGKTSREIKGCLARYVARDLYRLLESGTTAP